MKALTHDVFSLGAGLYLVYRIGQLPLLPNLLLVVWLTISTNKLIDILGHTSKGGLALRSFWTHSIFTAPIWGISAALASLYLLDVFLGQTMSWNRVMLAVGIGAVLSYSHLLLDSFTEGGIYLGRRRLAIAHLRYNNPVANGAFTALGAILILAALV